MIKATVPVLAQHGETITTKFYQNMLAAHPELKNVFNHTHQTTGNQPRALATALYAYASHIDDLGALSPAVELICHKHASLHIQPSQYDIVGTHLLETMKEVLGDALTPEIEDAWAAAYWQLADVMIAREEQLYEEAEGWTDWREFRIAKKESESTEITSFYLEPVDGKKLPLFKPGQYISINTEVPALGSEQARQYSLSDAPNESYYRISVKREPGLDMADPKATRDPGYMSNILHGEREIGDILRVSHPFGDFFLDMEKEKGPQAPVVLISAGVGLTCLMSILNTLVKQHSERQISWIHAARDEGVRAFTNHIQEVVKANKNVHAVLFNASPAKETVDGVDHQFQGRMDLEKVSKERDLFLGSKDSSYFLCGPTQFMLDMEAKLREFGVSSDRIKMELFGTGML